MAREREKKSALTKGPRRGHYEPAMSDELFRDSDGPEAAPVYRLLQIKCQSEPLPTQHRNKSIGERKAAGKHLLIYDLLADKMATRVNYW